MLPLLVLWTLCPVYMSSAFKHLVTRAQALLQVISFSANCLVSTPNGLVMQLEMGWPAAAWWCTAIWNHVEKHITSLVRVNLHCPPFLFLVVSGSKCSTAPACSLDSGTRYGTAFSPVGSTMLSNLSAPALKPLRHDCHSRLNSMPSCSKSICWCGSVLLLLQVWCSGAAALEQVWCAGAAASQPLSMAMLLSFGSQAGWHGCHSLSA